MSSRFAPVGQQSLGLASLALVACTSSVTFFGSSGAGGSGAGGADSSSTTASTGDGGAGAMGQGGTSSVAASSVAASSVAASSVAASSVAASSVAASSVAASSSSTVTGGGSMCAHDVCVQGMKLTIGCDACVDKVCASDKYCCETAWDAICTYRASTTCNVACPGDPATPNCKTLYGSTIGYSLCAENATTCEFAINQTQNTCAAACAKAGGECVASFNDVNNNPCQKPQAPNLGTKSCDSTQWQSAICICSRGCGAGLPCPAGKSCKAGACG